MKKRKQGQVIETIISIIVLVILLFLMNVDVSEKTYFQALQSKIIIPFKKIGMKMKSHSKKEDRRLEYYNLEALQKENREQKQKIEELEKAQRNYEILMQENKTLNEKLNLKNRYDNLKSISASVIGLESSNFSKHAVLDVGKEQGVKEGQAVVADNGLYGKIIEVKDKTSKVELVIDPAMKFAAKSERTNEQYICKGSLEKEIILTLLPINLNLITGEIVKTSKVGNVFPEGIYVGKVKEIGITKNLSDKYAVIESNVDFENTTNVLVIINE